MPNSTAKPTHNLPGQYQCSQCGTNISVIQSASGGICDSVRCLQKKAVFERNEIDTRKKKALENIGLEYAKPIYGPTITAIGVPFQNKPVSTQSESDQREFKNSLKAAIREAGNLPTVDKDSADEINTKTENHVRSIDYIQATVCSTCRGHCCNLGHGHAFLRAKHIRDRLTQSPDTSPSQLYRQYLKRIPAYSFVSSCIYHSETGCALTRELRSDVCNRFQCDPLQDVASIYLKNQDTTVVAVAIDDDKAFAAAKIQR